MSGFFKKLFNRITGKGTEEAKPEPVEQAALPAPEPAEKSVQPQSCKLKSPKLPPAEKVFRLLNRFNRSNVQPMAVMGKTE